MGNIQQESKFISNICEEVLEFLTIVAIAVVYGIIQWTTENRYRGLGNFANRYNCDPSALDCQTRYMISEYTFVKTLPSFEKEWLLSFSLYETSISMVRLGALRERRNIRLSIHK